MINNNIISQLDENSDKNDMSSYKLFHILQSKFPFDEIINISNNCVLPTKSSPISFLESNNIFLLKRKEKSNILINNIHQKKSITKEEVNNFISYVSEYNKTNYDNANGLIFSQYSKIAVKDNYIINGSNIVGLAPEINYHNDIILCSIHIIDGAYSQHLQSDNDNKILNNLNKINDIIKSEDTVSIYKGTKKILQTKETIFSNISNEIKEQFEPLSKNIKIFKVTYDINTKLKPSKLKPYKWDFVPFSININQLTLTKNLDLIQCPDDYTHTISYTISEINNIDFSLDHIKKIIKVVKNNNIIFTLNKKITITDIFNSLK